MAYISLRKFAGLRGVRLSAVQKAIADGRVTAILRKGDRVVGIDPVLAAQQWDANTDPTQAARSGQGPLGTPAAGAVQTSVQPGGLDLTPRGDGGAPAAEQPEGKDPHGYLAARADRERSQAQLAELELLEQLGKLVSVDEMRRVSGRRYRAIRDQVLNVPDRVAAILAAEKDPARVHALLTAELKRVLHELSDDARAEAARGIAESVAA